VNELPRQRRFSNTRLPGDEDDLPLASGRDPPQLPKFFER
jgi:hypothetical protein